MKPVPASTPLLKLMDCIKETPDKGPDFYPETQAIRAHYPQDLHGFVCAPSAMRPSLVTIHLFHKHLSTGRMINDQSFELHSV